MLAFIILSLLIQRSFSFEFLQSVDDLTKHERSLKPYHTVDTKSQEDFPGYRRHTYDDEESEELDPLLQKILSKTQSSNITDTTNDDKRDIFSRRQDQNRAWINDWVQKMFYKHRTITTTTTTTTPSTTKKPTTTQATPTESKIDRPINGEPSLSEVLQKLSSTLEQLTHILGDKEKDDGLVCVRVGSQFKDATRGLRKRRQAEPTEAKNSQNTTSPFRMYYLRKANRTLQSDKQVNVTAKNKHLEEVRNKLYSYIDEKFENVIKNAAPLQKLRIDLGENSGFKIGYLIANLDILIENIRKLKSDTDSKRDKFDEEFFLDTFNKLQSAFKVVASIETTVYKNLSDMKL